MLGTPVSLELVRAGFRVKALVRDPEKAKKKLNKSIELIKGDIRNKQDLLSAFKNCDMVYVSLSTDPKERNDDFKTETDGLRQIISACKESDIQRIGYLSSLIKDHDMDWWMFDLKREACDILRNSGLAVSIFYPSNFYENLNHLMMAGNNILLVGRQITRSYWISAHEYGEMVAKALVADTGSSEHVIQGPEAMNFDEAADRFIKAWRGNKLKKRRIPVLLLKAAGLISAEADFAWRINEAINNYDEIFEAQNDWELLGKPAITIEDYAKSAGADINRTGQD